MPKSWFRDEYERAKKLNAATPPHARMVVTSPVLNAHMRPANYTKTREA